MVDVRRAVVVGGARACTGGGDVLTVEIPRQAPAVRRSEAAGPETGPVTVVDDRHLVSMGVRSALGKTPEAARVVVVGRTPQLLDVVRAALGGGQRVVVLLDDAEHVGAARAALAAGAHGVALLDRDAAELVDVVRRVGDGGTAVAPAVASRLEEHQQLRQLFSPREREALALYATGLPAKSVARRMGSSVGTVKTYVKRLRAKARQAGVAADTRLDLAELARRIRVE